MMSVKHISIFALGVGLFTAVPAKAQLNLTPAGVADGFTLSTFATVNPGNTGCCAGPFGVAVDGNGNVFVGLGQGGPLYVFNDVDGRTPATALFPPQTNPANVGGFTASGGVVYGAVFGGNYVSFNNNGTVANSNVFPSLAGQADLGMWTNPVNGHIISNSSQGMIDINPATKTFSVITPSGGDGVSVSPDGKTAYSEQGSINGYDLVTHAQVFNSGNIFPSPDGTGVITGGKFNGQIIVNDNSGSVFLLDPATKLSTIIATGGTRGDYTQADPTNGTLFLDFSDVVERLGCGPDCSIGNINPGVPEPSTWAMMLLGFAALGFAFRQSRRKVSMA
jgi:hypothetical protein